MVDIIKINSKDIYDYKLNKMNKNKIQKVGYSYTAQEAQENVEISEHLSLKPYEYVKVGNSYKWKYIGNDEKKNGKYINEYIPSNPAVDFPSFYTAIIDFKIIKEKWILDTGWISGANPSYLKYNISYVDTSAEGNGKTRTFTRIQLLSLQGTDINTGESVSYEPELFPVQNIVRIRMGQDIVGGEPNPFGGVSMPEGALVTNIDMVLVGTALDLSRVDSEEPYHEKNKKTDFILQSNEFTTNNFFSTEGYTQTTLAKQIIRQWEKGKETAELKCQLGDYYYSTYPYNLAISDKSIRKHFFEIGDIVEPYVLSASGKDVPLSYRIFEETDEKLPKRFRVVGVDIIFNGCIWQKLTLQEV